MNQTSNEKALDVLKTLESFKYQEQDVKLGDVLIKLAPINARETIEVFESCAKFTDTDAMVQALKVETLARSIIAVNDLRFDPKSNVKEKREVVLLFGDELIDVLFSEYCILDKTIKISVDRRESFFEEEPTKDSK